MSLRELLEILRRRDRALIRYGLVTAVDDTGAVQKVGFKGIFGMIRQGIQSFMPFGFSSNPPVGSEVVQLQVNGDPGNPIIVMAFNRQYRITGLQPGESIMFNMLGDFVKIDASRNITVNAGENVNVTAATKVTVTAPNAEITGNLKVDGGLTVSEKAVFNSSASFAAAGKNVTVAATVGLLVITPGSLKINGTAVLAP